MSGARPDTWMPFYVGDYLRDTGRLTTEGHGAYVLLIFDYWTSGTALPDDDDQLAAIAKMPKSQWKKLRPILAQFFHVAKGVWLHKRIEEELEKAKAITVERSEAGSKGAAKRWQRHKQKDGTAIAEPLANSSQNDAPSPSPSSEAKASDAVASADPVKELFDSGVKILTKLGIAEKSARGLIGQCRKEFGADGPVFDLLLKIEKDRISEPCAYIEAAILRHKQPKVPAIGRAWG